ERVGHLCAYWPRALVEAETRIRKRTGTVGAERWERPNEPPAASRCVPLKAFRGFAGFEDLSDEERDRLRRDLRIEMSWGAPIWLQQALFFANGKRSAGAIAGL